MRKQKHNAQKASDQPHVKPHRTRRPPKRRVCLITGASAGIGAALAEEFARNGWDLALAARREEPMVALAVDLKKRYGTKSHILVADLSKPGASRDLYERLAKKKAQIDGLVNCAGYGLTGKFLDNDWSAHQDFLRLMLESPTELCHLFMDGMVERGFGRIINVASLAGHIPGSRGHTLYGAVKSYLIKFSQSLNLEMRDKGVKVSALCPGFTYSEFHDVNDTRPAVSKLPDWMWQEASEVAESGFIALQKNRAVFIPGRANKLMALAVRYLPESLMLSVMAKNSDKVRKG